MVLFDKPGVENTDDALRIAIDEAKKGDYPLVLSSNEGVSAFRLLEMTVKEGLAPRVVCVSQVCGFRGPGVQGLTPEAREKLEAMGAKVITAAHALTGAERGLMKRFQGTYPVAMIAESLRMLGQGSKVCVEIGAMAMDAGALEYGQPVVALGGTGRGLDTAMLLTPA